MFRPKMRFSFCLLTAVMISVTVAPAWASQAGSSPVKVFILAGQSNMVGHGHVKWGCDTSLPLEWYQNNAGGNRYFEGGYGSLRYEVDNDPARYGYGGTRPLVDAGGDWAVRDDVWVRWDDRKGELTTGFGDGAETIGPEFGFGHVVGDYFDEQVLLIKTAWGGKSLAVDFRPPSAVAKRGGEVGAYYNEMVDNVKDALRNLATEFPDYDGQGYQIAGFGWHQGWNDRINNDRVAEYEANLADLIYDVRGQWGADLPFVIANTGIGGEDLSGNALALVEAQGAMVDFSEYPEFEGNVGHVDTRGLYRNAVPAWGQGYHWHWNGETHYLIGEGMGETMVVTAPEPGTITTYTWDNNTADDQWETEGNWDEAGQPSAANPVIIDNGETVALTVAGELAASFALGQTAASTLDVSGDLTVTGDTIVYGASAVAVTGTGTLDTGELAIDHSTGTVTIEGVLTASNLGVTSGGTLSSGTAGTINVATSAALGAETITYSGGVQGFTLTGTDLGDKTAARTVGILGDTVTIAGTTVDMPETDLDTDATAGLALNPGSGGATLGDLDLAASTTLTVTGTATSVSFDDISGNATIAGAVTIKARGSVSPGVLTMATEPQAGTIHWDSSGARAITMGSVDAGDVDVLKSGDTLSIDGGTTTLTTGEWFWAISSAGANSHDDSATIDGVYFTETDIWGDLNETTPIATVLGGGTTGDSEYDTLIGSLDRTAANPATITIPGLTSGDDYVVQVWYADSRQTTRNMVFAGTNPLSLLAADWEFGNGVFTADGTTQDLSITGVDGKVHVSGVQVRELVSDFKPHSPSIGTLTVSNAVTLESGAKLVAEVQGATSDLLEVGGTLTMTGAEIQLDWMEGSTVAFKFGGTYTIATYTSLTGTPTVNTAGNIGAAYIDGALNNTGTALQVTLHDLGDGDCNIDGVVDSLDLSAFGQGWGSSSPTWANGDFNFDGTVDSLDLSAFGQGWGWSAGSAGAAGTNPVPEPGTIVMLLIGAAGLLLYRKRR